MYKNLTRLFVLTVIMILSGCGFYLRGQIPLPGYLDDPYIEGSSIELVQRLKVELLDLGASPKTEALNASSILELLRVSFLREVGSLDNRGKVTGYVLKYEVVYRVLNPDLSVLIEETYLTLSRNLDYDRGEVLQLQREESFLRGELVDEVVKRIVERLLKFSANNVGHGAASSWKQNSRSALI